MIRPTLIALGLLTSLACVRAYGDALYEAFVTPAENTRPFVRWWWNGGRVNAAEIVRELDVLKAAGIGGVEINTIGMPDGASASSMAAHPAVSWLSPQWSELVSIAARAAHERNMTADLIVGSGWPFGGRFLDPSEQTQRILLVKRPLQGPARVLLTRAELVAPPAISEPSAGHEEPPPSASELLFLRLVSTDASQQAFAPGKELLPTLGNADRIAIDIPAGEHVLYTGVWQTGFTHVKLGAPGADGPVVNHFNAAAVRKYLDHLSTHLAPALNGNIGSAIRATFVDSLELDHANWTDDLAAEFKRRRGYDLLPYLPFVLEPDNPKSESAFTQTIRRARYDFDKTLVELFDERFLSTYVAWAEANQVKARIQAYGRELHPLEGSMKVHLPEGETWLWVDKIRPERIRPDSTVINKYVASGANLTGQRLRSFEAMTNAVPAFRETLQDFKRGFDATLLAGLNHPIIHGFNYTPLDAGFPGWVRFGSYLNERTPWWPYLSQFNDYAARLGTVMRQSDAHARIAVLAPRPDEWSRHGLLYQPFPEVSDPWYQFKLINAIQQAGYNADYISEKILTDGQKIGGQLRFGPCAYDLLVLENIGAMEPAAAAALADYVAGGGRVIFIGQIPFQSPGINDAARNDARVTEAMTRIRQAPASQVRQVEAPQESTDKSEAADEQILLDFSVQWLAHSQLTPDVTFEKPQTKVSQITHRTGDRLIYFIANADDQAGASVRASFPQAVGRPYRWNPHTGEKQPLSFDHADQLLIELEPADSALIVFDPAEKVTHESFIPPRSTAKELLTLSGPWQLRLTAAGTAETTERTLPSLVDFSAAKNDASLRDFGGVATYQIDFEAPASAQVMLDLGEVRDVSEVTLNGVNLGSRWWGRHHYPLTAHLRSGKNHLKIKVSTMLANQMRSKRDDPAAQRWASWAPPIPAGLIGPVRLLNTPGTANDMVKH